MYNETVKLVNEVEVPRLALGTWLIDDDKAADAVRAAIKLGYRHIDTAQAYGNEKGVGEGVRASGVDRKEIFINLSSSFSINIAANSASLIRRP